MAWIKVVMWFRFQRFHRRDGEIFHLVTSRNSSTTGHVHYYVLESIGNVNENEEEDLGLGHMTDRQLKNGRKYVHSGFVHDLMDTMTALPVGWLEGVQKGWFWYLVFSHNL